MKTVYNELRREIISKTFYKTEDQTNEIVWHYFYQKITFADRILFLTREFLDNRMKYTNRK